MSNGAEYRISEIIDLYQQLNPDLNVDVSTKINNATIARICETGGGPYQRVKSWIEKQLELKSLKEIEGEDMRLAKVQFDKCFELMKGRNAKYGDSYKKLRLNSIIDLMIMKLDRCQKQELDDHAMEVEIEDVVNYGIFGLVNIRNK